MRGSTFRIYAKYLAICHEPPSFRLLTVRYSSLPLTRLLFYT